ncbi:MAG: TatD family hydrolase [Gammaproteobacteria bacterium]|nr:TatD family hydrolase [Gammaproteobacteria bacterium]MBU1407470.1 TatD family hydrolase [Gammaproteobacteria bacterium]MBU1531583.1 TatD family hydrolase [Gammaproteobacteria bacterium]
MPFFIDTHCHLDAAEFDADRDAVYAAAIAGGVDTLVVPAVSHDNFAAVAATCARYPGCLPAWGLHPMYIDVHRPEHLADLRAQIETQRPVAIGEIGLDLFVNNLDYATQEFFYVEQLKIARDYDLPVLLHCRKANDELLKQLRKIGVRGGIAHAFNGSPQQADAFIKLGFKLGFGGAFTWPRANNLRRLAVDLPLSAIVLETDSPDIPPAWIGRGRNAPGELPRIADTLAELRGLDLDAVAQATTRNARELFSLN